jgi:hypothetical protein
MHDKLTEFVTAKPVMQKNNRKYSNTWKQKTVQYTVQ